MKVDIKRKVDWIRLSNSFECKNLLRDSFAVRNKNLHPVHTDFWWHYYLLIYKYYIKGRRILQKNEKKLSEKISYILMFQFLRKQTNSVSGLIFQWKTFITHSLQGCGTLLFSALHSPNLNQIQVWLSPKKPFFVPFSGKCQNLRTKKTNCIVQWLLSVFRIWLSDWFCTLKHFEVSCAVDTWTKFSVESSINIVRF